MYQDVAVARLSTQYSVLSTESRPLECPLAPGVKPAEEQQDDEDHHLDETEPAERIEDDGPRVNEDRLHVEDDEENSNDVVSDGDPVARAGDTGDTALIGGELDAVGPLRANQGAGGDHPDSHRAGHREGEHDKQPVAKHRCPLAGSRFGVR